MNYILASCLLLSALSPAVAGASIRGHKSFRGSTLVHRDGEVEAYRHPCSGDETTFEAFVQLHSRSYEVSSTEYVARKALFDQRAEEARAHNCRPGQILWKAGTTSLADWTDEELARLRGRRGASTEAGQPSSGGTAATEQLATLETDGRARRGAVVPPLPDSFSWSNLESMNEVFDQGACGSCWASATTVMLRAHSDIYQSHKNFSVQQLVSCVPNPQVCGGTGGCDGSTGELALDYVQHNGLSDTTELPYEARDVVCPHELTARRPNPIPQPNSSFLAFSPGDHAALQQDASPAHKFGMVGWRRLPVNDVQALKHSLYREGPVAVSVVAGYAWNAYVSGIMDNCSTDDTVVNHLVVLIGYGAEPSLGTKFWQIQNSWGNHWGEQGHIRMIRHDDKEEQEFCGMDKEPKVGTGCEGGPAQVYVCGSCGILFDNVVAHFQGSTPQAQEMLQRRGQTVNAGSNLNSETSGSNP